MPPHTQVEKIGHRGAPREYRENTLRSFQRAVTLGATAVELDVHVTTDGVAVVHHDPTLPSDVSPRSFARVELASLESRALVGIRLDSGDAIPVLSDVLAALTPATRVYVEIKGGSPEVIAKAVEPFAEWIAVHSFNHDAIEEMARIAPTVARGILVERDGDLGALVRQSGARDVWPAWKLVNEDFMADARSAGVRVIPWTVNSVRQCRRLADLGVSGICTNDVTILSSLSR